MQSNKQNFNYNKKKKHFIKLKKWKVNTWALVALIEIWLIKIIKHIKQIIQKNQKKKKWKMQ